VIIDQGLLLAAEKLCTGANVHDINARRASYVAWIELANEPGITSLQRMSRDYEARRHEDLLRSLLRKLAGAQFSKPGEGQ
jgi:hypothetical protein